MEPAKTISVVCPENVRAGYKNIPAAEFDPAVHVPFDIKTGQPCLRHDGPTVAEYVPADWQSLHWKQRVALAEKLSGDCPLAPAAGQKPADAADAVIAAEIARRAGG
ncbi:hypothetical protein [Polaromonas sp.]|jgi:hypothetical protein|uniref:hypothetical protein n=1 Tax=Polaromonas sp. TaxID=1869339 RepID=UPI002CFF1EE7|nr:hypothetical protein [Polaromonas sp.]HQS33742.1 hypothetical protein [Polaromonas sp.]HQS92962.1 hypothetical protein [Polaromonas sp.]